MQVNLLEETEKALKNHGISWHTVRFIRNQLGYVPIADYITAAHLLYYDNESGSIQVDPSLKIVGRFWWLERFNYDGKEGWVYIKKPNRPTLTDRNIDLRNKGAILNVIDWERRIEK